MSTTVLQKILLPEVLTRIYGEENWEATIGKVEDEEMDEDSTTHEANLD